MGTENLGRVLVVHQGPYSASTSYEPLDEVSYNGSTYRCKANSTGTIPTDTSKWELVAAKGEPGETGATGSKGDTGESGANAPVATASQNGLMPKEVFEAWQNGDFTSDLDGSVLFSGSSTTAISVDRGLYQVSRYVETGDGQGNAYYSNTTSVVVVTADNTALAASYSSKITQIMRIL